MVPGHSWTADSAARYKPYTPVMSLCVAVFLSPIPSSVSVFVFLSVSSQAHIRTQIAQTYTHTSPPPLPSLSLPGHRVRVHRRHQSHHTRDPPRGEKGFHRYEHGPSGRSGEQWYPRSLHGAFPGKIGYIYPSSFFLLPSFFFLYVCQVQPLDLYILFLI